MKQSNNGYTLEKGDKFNKIEILSFSHCDHRNNKHFNCLCHCGNIFVTAGFKIKSGHTKSCGCTNRSRIIHYNKNADKKELIKRAKKGWETRLSINTFKSESDAISIVLKAGEKYGYGNMIDQLKKEWRKTLIEQGIKTNYPT